MDARDKKIPLSENPYALKVKGIKDDKKGENSCSQSEVIKSGYLKLLDEMNRSKTPTPKYDFFVLLCLHESFSV